MGACNKGACNRIPLKKNVYQEIHIKNSKKNIVIHFQ